MTDLSDKEKRLLTVVMGMVALNDLICSSSLVDDSIIVECEQTLDVAKKEYDRLFEEVDQDVLREKISSPLDPPGSPLATELRKRLMRSET